MRTSAFPEDSDAPDTQTQTERNKAVILEILTTAFSSKDFTALDRHLHPDYVQHNAFIPPAKAGLRGFIADLPDTTRYEPGAIIAEGDLVMVSTAGTPADSTSPSSASTSSVSKTAWGWSTGTSCRTRWPRRTPSRATPCSPTLRPAGPTGRRDSETRRLVYALRVGARRKPDIDPGETPPTHGTPT
ncbi:hypothetical protein GCM10010317_102590 [Streptomyces mirabilis]|nr:hypothetical protein GCM10010317_102590 [Streptomyces mirabilis]